MPGHLDLHDLLATGDFFGFNAATTADEVFAELGKPDCSDLSPQDVLICQYGGGIELAFFKFDADLTLMLLHCDDLPPTGSDSMSVEPWIISKTATLESLTSGCRNAGIRLSRKETRQGIRWRTSGGVDLTFEDSHLATFMIDYLDE